MAGAGGFEPPVHGTKARCLTTWLRPKGSQRRRKKYSRAGKKGQERSHLAQSAAKAFSHCRSAPEIVRPTPPEESRPSCSQGETPFNEYFASIRCWEETRAPCGSASVSYTHLTLPTIYS